MQMAGVKSFFCVLWSLCLCGVMVGRAADYDALWKQVRQFERQGLTKSAYEVVEQIGVKADKEHKEGQQMAALIYGCKLRQCIVPDSFYADIVRLEKLKRDARDEVRRAVWASVLAGLYKDNAGRNRSVWLKKVKGPERMREWASGEWKDASDANFDLSLSHPELLAEVKAADYLPFIEQGEHAAYFGGDLLNVIGRRAVMARKDYKAKEDREAVAGYCAKMLQEYRSRRNREAELLVLLDSLAQSSDEMVGETNRFVWEASSEERERKELDERGYGDYCRLLDRFGDLPLAAEVYLQWMDWSVTAKRKRVGRNMLRILVPRSCGNERMPCRLLMSAFQSVTFCIPERHIVGRLIIAIRKLSLYNGSGCRKPYGRTLLMYGRNVRCWRIL